MKKRRGVKKGHVIVYSEAWLLFKENSGILFYMPLVGPPLKQNLFRLVSKKY